MIVIVMRSVKFNRGRYDDIKLCTCDENLILNQVIFESCVLTYDERFFCWKYLKIKNLHKLYETFCVLLRKVKMHMQILSVFL